MSKEKKVVFFVGAAGIGILLGLLCATSPEINPTMDVEFAQICFLIGAISGVSVGIILTLIEN